MEPVALKPISGYDESLSTPIIQKKDFISELINNGNLIVRTKLSDGNETYILYTVPEGKTFYLLSATLGIQQEGVSVGRVELRITDAGKRLAVLEGNGVVAFQFAINQTFTVPLKLNQGETLVFYSSGLADDGNGQIIGYEVAENLKF